MDIKKDGKSFKVKETTCDRHDNDHRKRGWLAMLLSSFSCCIGHIAVLEKTGRDIVGYKLYIRRRKKVSVICSLCIKLMIMKGDDILEEFTDVSDIRHIAKHTDLCNIRTNIQYNTFTPVLVSVQQCLMVCAK